MPIRCSRKTRATLVSAALLVGVSHLIGPSHACWASAITFSSGSVASAVRISVPDSEFLSDGASGFDSGLGSSIFQASDLVLGNGPVTDAKPFSFGHTLGLSTVPEMPGSEARPLAPGLPTAPGAVNEPGLTNAPGSREALSIFAGTPSGFGDKLFTLDPATLTSAAYEDPTPVRVELTATDAERLRLLLLGAGVFAVLMLAAAGHRSLGPADANVPPVPMRQPILGKAWVQRGATFRPPAKAGARSAQPAVSFSEPACADRRSAAGPQPSTA